MKVLEHGVLNTIDNNCQSNEIISMLTVLMQIDFKNF